VSQEPQAGGPPAGGYPGYPARPGYPPPHPGYPARPNYPPPHLAYPPGYPGYPPSGFPSPGGVMAAPNTESGPRLEVLVGTGFGLLYPPVTATVSGAAVGSLVAGVGSVLVCGAELLFGAYAANYDAGPLVAGAFLILALLLGTGAGTIGSFAARQIRRSAGALRGRGLAISGLAVGACGAGLAILAFMLVLVASATTVASA
jgi:hypothetical protein